MVETKHSLVLCVIGLVLGSLTSLATINAKRLGINDNRLERALVPPAGGQVRSLNGASGVTSPSLEKARMPPAGGQVRSLNGASGRTRSATVQTADLRTEVNAFLAKELAAHVADIKTLDPPPDRVVGALTTGEFSWGTFMRAVAAFADTAGQNQQSD